MKRIIRWTVLLLALALLAAGIWHGVHPKEPVAAAGSSAGLGLMLLEREAGLYVLAVTQDSPADRAGIHPGDYLLRAAEQELWQVAALDALIDADPGRVTLELRRDDQLLQVALPTR